MMMSLRDMFTDVKHLHIKELGILIGFEDISIVTDVILKRQRAV